MIMRLLAIICMISISSVPANAFWFGGGGSGVPGGTNEQVQYRNETGTFSGHVGLTYDASTAKLTTGYFSQGTARSDLLNGNGGSWVRSRQLTITAPAQALPAGYSVRVALAGATAASVFNSGTVDALRIATSVATVATTITAAITDVQTTIPVASVAGLTTVGIIKIENEYVGYNGWTGLTLNNCVRGSMGSTPATHVNATTVTSIQELERYVDAYTASSVIVWFKTRESIAAAGTNTNYTLYYENDAAGASPSMIDNVFTKKLETDTTLQCEWHCDEGVASTVNDSSGNVNTLTATGANWQGSDSSFVRGNQLTYTGTNYLARASDAFVRPNTGNWSVEFRMYRTGAGTGDFAHIIGARPYSDAVDLGWAVEFGAPSYPNRITTHFADGATGWDVNTSDQSTSASDMDLNAYNHWVIVFDRTAGHLRFYKNGVLDADRTPAFPTGAINQTTEFRVGMQSNRGVHGRLDAIRCYNRVVTADEALAMNRQRKWVVGDTSAINGNFTAAGNEVVSGDYVGELKSLNNTTLKKLSVIEGTNCSMGLSTLVAGSVVVNNTLVTANSRIFLTKQTDGSSGYVNVTARTAGVSFTIASSSGTDTASIAWWIVEPQ